MNKIQKRELVELMFDWEMAKEHLENLETRIKELILEEGESITVGNVRASYSKGRTVLDYEQAVKDSSLWETDPDFIRGVVDGHSHVSVSVAYKGACEELGLEPEIKSQGQPSVSVKLC